MPVTLPPTTVCADCEVFTCWVVVVSSVGGEAKTRTVDVLLVLLLVEFVP